MTIFHFYLPTFREEKWTRISTAHPKKITAFLSLSLLFKSVSYRTVSCRARAQISDSVICSRPLFQKQAADFSARWIQQAWWASLWNNDKPAPKDFTAPQLAALMWALHFTQIDPTSNVISLADRWWFHGCYTLVSKLIIHEELLKKGAGLQLLREENRLTTRTRWKKKARKQLAERKQNW